MELFGSLRPLIFVSRIFGLAPVKFENGNLVTSRDHLCYSALVLGCGIIILVKELIKKGSFEVGRIQEPLWSIAVVLKLMTYIICSILMTFNAIFRVSETAKSYNRISELYTSMRTVDHEYLAHFILKLLFTNMFMIFACFSHSFIGFYNASVFQMFQVLFQYIFFLLINVATTHFVVFVHLIRLSYSGMSKALLHEARTPVSVRRVAEELRKTRGHDIEAKDIVEEVNTAYMPFLLFYIFWLFTNKIHGFMWITHQEFSWVPLILYSICFDGLVVYVLSVCSSSYDEAEKTANYLHELFIDNDDPDLKEEIEIFSLQLLHRKVEFNACGFFKLDFSLLYSMVGAVTTYIIILMQFQGNGGHDHGNCTAVKCGSNCTMIAS